VGTAREEPMVVRRCDGRARHSWRAGPRVDGGGELSPGRVAPRRRSSRASAWGWSRGAWGAERKALFVAPEGVL